MSYYGGGWTYIYQQQVVNSAGLSWTNSYQGTQNDASSAFRGVQDNNGNNHTPQAIWNGIVGSSNDGAFYLKKLKPLVVLMLKDKHIQTVQIMEL